MIHYWRTIAVSLATLLSALPLGIASAEPTVTRESDTASCVRRDFRVVLDVGHTAKSPGAKSARGADEFDFNLRLAKLIDQALLDAGFAKTVLMVTDGRANRSLYARVARANDLSANLLLSIHHTRCLTGLSKDGSTMASGRHSVTGSKAIRFSSPTTISIRKTAFCSGAYSASS